MVKKRVEGKGGDPIMQIQTPFGGGKTHALIAMYHKVQEWGAKRAVIVGTALSPHNTLWGIIEEQLTGKIVHCPGQVSPGKETIRALLSEHQPLVILMDEVLEYATKAAGVQVGSSHLAAQSVAFMQELSEAVSTLEKVCLVVTLPASLLEHYDEGAEKLFQQLQKVSGRVEKIYTPVEEHEIASIIRRRLFSHIDPDKTKAIVSAFVEYAEKESILPADVQPGEYRARFTNAYPFMPEVIDVLYHRWGSFHTFQRTRGVLRLLSLVIHHLKDSNKSYISLADFDLSQQELRQELLKHIGPEFNSVIGADISASEAGSRKVDNALGKAYQGLRIGSRTATTIFLYSFSGGQEHGTTLGELKRSATTLENPSPLVAEAIELLKTKLFYLQSRGEKYFFSNQANLNRILLNTMENVKEPELTELEKNLLRSTVKGSRFKTYLWEDNSLNIADSEEIKCVILKKDDNTVIKDILKSKGQTPRVYRNTMFFLYPLESERSGFITTLKRKIAFETIAEDQHLRLTEEQKKEVKEEIKKLETPLKEAVRRLYRLIAIPEKDGYKQKDLGIATYGLNKSLDEEVYEQLRLDGEILEKIAPIVLREKYLVGKEYVFTDQLFQSTLQTPGEARPANRMVLESGIREGVQMGLFGLGELESDGPECFYFKENATISFSGKEVIIRHEICERQQQENEVDKSEHPVYGGEREQLPVVNEGGKQALHPPLPVGQTRTQLQLKFELPKGKVAGIMGMMNLLQSKFHTLEISLKAKNGSISQQEIEDKIEETFRQLNIHVDLSEED
ncbi:MAG: ATP-binding protein [Syntrophaceae bacterium]|nr:ATP-binding protein [Syntrophaceae bacterium]